jgi:glutaminyl-peptide cyclotransferase
MTFDGERAYQDVAYQVSLGPRLIGSEAHSSFIDWVSSQLCDEGWQVEIQETVEAGVPIRNVIARRGVGTPLIILGAHYDSRFWADQDPNPENWRKPVPGANDGASGVAVLLELARVLPSDLDKQVWLVFFDAEDNGNIPGYDWILGSRAFVKNLTGMPDAVVIVDMIGDADLNIHYERNSDRQLSVEIWEQAANLGYENEFIQSYKYSILDDHTPFLEAGIPAVDLIDFDYPYWHTIDDTLDKVSARSLKVVGDTLLEWIIAKE